MSVTCYPSFGKRKALKLCKRFADGCGGSVAPVGHPRLEPGPAFFYGWTEHTAALIAQCRAEARVWYYADNAYYYGRGTYFRITKNALMHDGAGGHGSGRLTQLRKNFPVEMTPWRTTGNHIVIATQSDLFCRLKLGIGREAWAALVTSHLERHTDREIVVCNKPERGELGWGDAHAPTLEATLNGAWCLVTHSSSAGVKAACDGVPVIALAPSMFSSLGAVTLADIETPPMPDWRLRWLENLAANQWAKGEISDGTCWRDLQSNRRKILNAA